MRKQLAVHKMTKHQDPTASLPNFIVVFGSSLQKIMVDSVNYPFQVGSLSVSQRLGIISLIPKREKN